METKEKDLEGPATQSADRFSGGVTTRRQCPVGGSPIRINFNLVDSMKTLTYGFTFFAGGVFALLLVAALTDHSEIQYCLDALEAVKETQPIYPK